MCGIAGILSFNKPVDVSQLKLMTDKLVHRGPDGEGHWLNENRRVGLGHRRLSIIDLSDAAVQPMHYADGRYTISFNGEIYNYPELKKQLTGKGYKFTSQSDTEVLLALYDQKKEKCLSDLDGMFAFAIWDNVEKKLFCARDRFGEKPFFYSQDSEYFVFASEMKALFAAGISKDTSDHRLFNYLLYTSLESPSDKSGTFFKHIKQLEPAHYLVLGLDGKLITKKYWDIDLQKKIQLKETEYFEAFADLFKTSIERRLRSDVPVGSSLSGGLDSSSVVMIIDRMKGKGQLQKTFSARFKNFSKDEGKYMDIVINKCNVEPHFVYPTVDSAFANLEKISYHQEEPIASASIFAQYEVMKLAKDNGVTVLLDGQGADETMAGYLPYWHTYFLQLYGENKKKLEHEEKTFQANLGFVPEEHDFSFRIHAIFPNLFKTLGNLRRNFISSGSDYFMGIDSQLARQYRTEPNPIGKFNSLRQHLYFSTFRKGLGDLLRYADRNAMANSVEVRLPFLNHELVEFLFSVPDDLLLRDGWSKYILRKSMENILPQEIAWRKDKIGYEPPQEEWLSDPRFKDYLNSAVTFLKDQRIIKEERSSMSWTYISLYSFLNAFK